MGVAFKVTIRSRKHGRTEVDRELEWEPLLEIDRLGKNNYKALIVTGSTLPRAGAVLRPECLGTAATVL